MNLLQYSYIDPEYQSISSYDTEMDTTEQYSYATPQEQEKNYANGRVEDYARTIKEIQKDVDKKCEYNKLFLLLSSLKCLFSAGSRYFGGKRRRELSPFPALAHEE